MLFVRRNFFLKFRFSPFRVRPRRVIRQLLLRLAVLLLATPLIAVAQDEVSDADIFDSGLQCISSLGGSVTLNGGAPCPKITGYFTIDSVCIEGDDGSPPSRSFCGLHSGSGQVARLVASLTGDCKSTCGRECPYVSFRAFPPTTTCTTSAPDSDGQKYHSIHTQAGFICDCRGEQQY